MADVTLKYKGATIGELSETGNKTIETAGKYCEADILLEYLKPESEPWDLIIKPSEDIGRSADGGWPTAFNYVVSQMQSSGLPVDKGFFLSLLSSDRQTYGVYCFCAINATKRPDNVMRYGSNLIITEQNVSSNPTQWSTILFSGNEYGVKIGG